jgi:hypothetical protein
MIPTKKIESHLRLSSKETDIIGLTKKLHLAKGLIEEGGRPSIVAAVCQITKIHARQLHKEVHGEGPSAGLLPYDEDWVSKSPDNCLHSSVYYNIYDLLCKNSEGVFKAEIYLSAYRLYTGYFKGDAKMNINRAWHIIQQLSMSYIAPVKCEHCMSTFIAVRKYPDSYKFCPLCDVLTDVTGRKRWQQIRETRKYIQKRTVKSK